MSRRRMLLAAVTPEAPLTYGVYIQDTTGKLWKAEAWNGSATPNGVAVYDESCSFIIALDGDTLLPINSARTATSLPTHASFDDAIADFDGFGNTEILMREYGSVTSEAAGYCVAYTFPNGQKGYLGSAGEWNTVFKYKDEINAIMSLLGGDALEAIYWTSTYGTKSGLYYVFWYLDRTIGLGATAKLTLTNYTRPFGVLDIEGNEGNEGNEGGSGTVKTENKITILFDTSESPTLGTIVTTYANSQYPVASDITVTAGTTSNSYTFTISEGETASSRSTRVSTSILSVTPTEDDTYIYTF